MKTFQQFVAEGINIAGDFNGTLNIGGLSSPKQVGEDFAADLVWQGQLYRMEFSAKDGIPSRERLAEELQSQYPGAIVHQIYPINSESKNIQVKDSKRYHPAKLDWV